VIVRNAIAEDFPQYLPLAHAFHAASPMHEAMPFNDKGFYNFFLQAVQNPNMGVWLAEDEGKVIGIAGALFYSMYFSPSSMVAQELWWWLAPEARGKGAGQAMYDMIEAWATAKNATALFMVALEDANAEKMSQIYHRKGFRLMERTYMKKVP
jgi:GNAT superfamily N-acetyltransferase